MSSECSDLSKPITDDKLPSELGRKFYRLFQEAYDLFRRHRDEASVKDAAALLQEHFKEEVTAHPLLASAVSNDCLQWSLLEVVCKKTYGTCADTMQLLIETNPHALLWARPDIDGFIEFATIHMLPRDGYGELFPWIVEHYPWVFQHELCQELRPHVELLNAYGNNRCDLQTVRKFYELYPQGLREIDRSDPMVPKYPLHAIVRGWEEPDADLFIWMAEQYTEAVYHESIPGRTVLHDVCFAMGQKENEFENVNIKSTPNMAKICRYLISQHPRLIRKQVHGEGSLPIHHLANACNRPLVQEMVILLLKAYPACIAVQAYRWDPFLPQVPFIQQVLPHILNESIIDREILRLKQMSRNMRKAAAFSQTRLNSSNGSSTAASNSSLFASVAVVFCSWANLRVSDILPARKQRLQDRMAEICRSMEGEDVPDEEYEEDDWDEDESDEDMDDFDEDE
ncbi:hypothetical protein FisN_6Hh258 [Fistulifera solaris]|uniref:Uncharacterized protein n=1 Tax=Fistulifera solaris TaxID=1519565 RepID=A0A1Z5K7E1_FISSO|nr:hypothetical protein FisN_6Hh258 [Fistulifera solaris]|eukprot:GAX22011.1 hypothetical protein FisN_6Hh258 [Fistulifera solaris]